jgi:hypothetical protein
MHSHFDALLAFKKHGKLFETFLTDMQIDYQEYSETFLTLK